MSGWPEKVNICQIDGYIVEQGHRRDGGNYTRTDLVPGWVSCEERMPNKGDLVDIIVDGGRRVNYYLDGYSPNDPDSLFWYPAEVATSLIGGRSEYEHDAGLVTHWMPTPPLPQEGSDEMV